MSNSGQVWPNFAYPKIYGYNLKNDERLRKTIFYNRGPIDRLHWKLHSLRGLDIVRRRIRPDHLYLETVSDSSELSHYFILARSNQDDLSIQRIDERQSSVLTNYVLRAEYGYIFNHLLWHQYNRTILSEKPIITVDELFERWQTAAESVFNKVLCYLVRIPASVPHEEIMPRLVSLIREKLGE